MCAPLAIIGGAVAGVSSLIGGISAYQQGKFQQKMARANAAAEAEASRVDQDNAKQAALARYREAAQVRGAQRARAGASGVGLDFGTSHMLGVETEMILREDVGNIQKSAFNKQRERDTRIANFIGEGRAAKKAGTMALAGSVVDFGSSVLGGVQQHKKNLAERKT